MELTMKREPVYYKPNMNNLRGKWGKRIIQQILESPVPDYTDLERLVQEEKAKILEAQKREEI